MQQAMREKKYLLFREAVLLLAEALIESDQFEDLAVSLDWDSENPFYSMDTQKYRQALLNALEEGLTAIWAETSRENND